MSRAQVSNLAELAQLEVIPQPWIQMTMIVLKGLQNNHRLARS